ncbi:MAG TPA: thermonuclease family protein [Alkalispirochaeta sp.]|nr:thermonuclease family protein [Alkalispirochaeta sp.]
MNVCRTAIAIALVVAILPILSAQSTTDSVWEITIERVIDGDTIIVVPATGNTGNTSPDPRRSITVRLYGIDAPETDQPGGKEATNFVREWATHSTVELVLHTTDRYGRFIGELRIPGNPDRRTLNEALVSRGLAWWYREYSRDDAELAALHAQAQAERRGVWADDSPIPPWEWR